MNMKHIAIALLVLVPNAAAAQQSTIYGRDGRVVGRAATDSQGTTTTYGADGRVITRESAGARGPRACPFTTSCFERRGEK